MQKIVLATNNIDKIREFTHLFKDLPVTIISQTEFKIKEPDETGATFVENAIIKARNACKFSGLPALADDSGLTVDALNGAPGIFSARFAGSNVTYQQNSAKNIEKVLTLMQDIPQEKRTARFHCVLVLLKHADDPAPIIAHGIWEGSILFAPKGTNGFGYDPILFVPTHNCSAAELLPEIKNQISHRAQACKKLFYTPKYKIPSLTL